MKLTLNIEPKPQSRPRFTRYGRAYDDPKDDGQIALHDVGKFYSLNPRIEIEIEEMRWNG